MTCIFQRSIFTVPLVGVALVIGLQPCTAANQSQANQLATSKREAHAWSEAAFAKPKAQRRNVGMGRRLGVPFSFKYDGKSSDEFLDRWQFSTRASSKNNITIRTNTYTDPKTGLVIECEIKTYREFAAVDWVCRLTNRGKTNTPIVESFMPLDSGTLFGGKVTEGSATLRWCNGDRYRSDGQGDAGSFLAHDEKLVLNRPRHFDSLATFTNLPFFNIQVPRGGWILAVGWTGFWQAEFAHNPRGDISVRAGMQKTRFYLKPGESVRTPSMVLMRWTGDDMSTGHNEFRKLVFVHYCQKLDGKVALPPIAFNSCAVPYVRQKPNEPLGLLNEAGELAVIDYIADLGCDTYWMDAYWYPQPWHLNIGNWFCRPDDFPRGLRPLADAAHAKGMKFVLWMLPPSVAPNTKWGSSLF